MVLLVKMVKKKISNDFITTNIKINYCIKLLQLKQYRENFTW